MQTTAPSTTPAPAAAPETSAETRPIVDCTWCGKALSEEEAEHPDRDDDGDAICDCCHTEHFTDNCSRCAELVDNDDLDTTPGQLIAIYNAAPVAGKDDLEPGYYRILKRPFFADGMIEGYFYGDALQRVAALDAEGMRAALEAYCLAGPLCPCCRAEVEVLVTRNGFDMGEPGGDQTVHGTTFSTYDPEA